MELDLFDYHETDGKMVFVPRGGAPLIEIPEDDLGALSDPTKQEPRIIETLQLENDVPESVWIRFFDADHQFQEAAQYQKRISQPYASDLASGRPVTNSRTQLTLSSEVTDSAIPM